MLVARLFLSLLIVSLLTNALADEVPYKPSLKDKYEWLVPLKDKKALEWVNEQNKKVEKTFFSDPSFPIFKKEVFEVVSSGDEINPGALRGDGFLYNIDKSKDRKFGLWRRIRFDSLVANDKSKWEPLLDLDKLSKEEGQVWTFKRAVCLEPKYTRCLLLLSLAGADVAELREFDLTQNKFVPDGFHYKAANTQVLWFDVDHILIASDFGEGTVTNGGWPLQAKLWKRGDSIDKAKLVYDSKVKGTTGFGFPDFGESMADAPFAGEWVSFRDVVYYLFKNGSYSLKLDLPLDCEIRNVKDGVAFLTLLSDWETRGKKFARGSILTLNLREVLANKNPLPELFYLPKPKEVILTVDVTKKYIWVETLTDVVARWLRFEKKGKVWKSQLVKLPDGGTIEPIGIARNSDQLILGYESFLVPDTYYAIQHGELTAKRFHSVKEDFSAKEMVVERQWTKSQDGTEVPYFLIHKKNMKWDGSTPTLLWGYGAGNISYSPFYLGAVGKAWIQRGGAYATAILRGGGELGPDWRKGGYQENKPNTFADFIAVAEDLERRKVTSPKHLGIYGGSWGGLLVSAAFIKRPELFGAVMPEVPMEDMLNYTLFRSGWAGEFGDPENPKYTGVLRSYSPYHNVTEGVKYPPVFITSALNDDRMHPAHPRRMVAKMLDQGHTVYYWEAQNGGHNGAADNEDLAVMRALRYVFFSRTLGLPVP